MEVYIGLGLIQKDGGIDEGTKFGSSSETTIQRMGRYTKSDQTLGNHSVF